jgi:hypothetical protein
VPGWDDESGVIRLPAGARVRGRRLADPVPPADFALVLAVVTTDVIDSRRGGLITKETSGRSGGA